MAAKHGTRTLKFGNGGLFKPDAAACEVLLQIDDANQVKVKHRCRQQDIRPGPHGVIKVFQFAGSTGRYDTRPSRMSRQGMITTS